MKITINNHFTQAITWLEKKNNYEKGKNVSNVEQMSSSIPVVLAKLLLDK